MKTTKSRFKIRIPKSKKGRIMTAVAFLLIVVGICIAMRPLFLAWRFDRMQNSLLNAWNATSRFNADSSRIGWQRSVAALGGEVDEVWEEDTNPRVDMNYIVNNMDGILTIKKINFNAPIISKYTTANLSISICTIIPENKMGQAGNYVLAGHMSRIRGRHFSRLVELKVGDLLVAENKEAKYTYQVTDIFTVTPEDVWVMANDGDKKIITLITCDYRTDPIGRLIVRGELIASETIAISK